MQQEAAKAARPLFTRQALIRLAVPLVIEQLLLMTVGMADTIMVTSAGEAAVSGVSLVDSINLLIIQIFSALSTGGAVVVSQYLGRQDREGACTAARQLIYAMTAVSTLLMLLALLLRQHILALVFGNIEPDVMDNALSYFLVTAIAYPFMALYNAGSALFRAMGNSKVSMFNSLLVNIVNISVNAVLIYPFQMGAVGAAFGTLASRVVAAVLILMLLYRPDHVVNICGLSKIRLRWDMQRRILTIGIPNGLENGMFQTGKLLVLNLITSFGTAAVAANAIANSIAGVVNVPGQAMGLSLITVVGQCMGAREPEQAVSYTKKLLITCYTVMGSMCVILFFSAGALAGLFQLSPEAAGMATQVLRWCAVFQLVLWPISFCLPNALRAAGDAIFTMAVSMGSMFLFRIGFSYVLSCSWGLGLGLLGVWLAMIIDWLVRGIVFAIRFVRGKWKRIQLI